MSTSRREEQITGAMVGLAVGDALGYPHEFRTVAQVRREIGPDGIRDFLALKDKRFSRPIILGPDHPPGTYTDDTQMSLCVAEALVAHGTDDDDVLMADMGARFVRWSFSEENNRSPGETCGRACDRLREGVPWRDAGIVESKGAGAVMRVVPVGLFYDHLDDVVRVARCQSQATHAHPAALCSSAAFAIAVHLALRGASLEAVLAEIGARCVGEDAAFDALFAKFPHARHRAPEQVLIGVEKGRHALGESWVSEEAVFSALYCWGRAPDSFEEAVLCAVNTDGDSDTIATLVGGIMGARLGLSAIPARWREGVENSARLHELGRALSQEISRASSASRRTAV